jgi:hypothetical protein
MQLDSSGNLGLGVTPSATTGSGVKGFEIGGVGHGLLGNSGNVFVTQNVYFSAGFKRAASGYGTIYNQSGGVHSWNTSDTTGGSAGDGLVFNTGMTLDVGGNLLVGTTSTSGGVRLKVAGGIIGCLDVYNNTTVVAANLNIDSNGFFSRSTSSLKYKKNVQDAIHGLADLLKLRSVTYEGKSEVDAGKIVGGLIAEEVDEIGLTEFVQYAEDGSPDALSYGNMVSLCIKAIQEQQAIITALTTRITALEAK